MVLRAQWIFWMYQSSIRPALLRGWHCLDESWRSWVVPNPQVPNCSRNLTFLSQSLQPTLHNSNLPLVSTNANQTCSWDSKPENYKMNAVLKQVQWNSCNISFKRYPCCLRHRYWNVIKKSYHCCSRLINPKCKGWEKIAASASSSTGLSVQEMGPRGTCVFTRVNKIRTDQ